MLSQNAVAIDPSAGRPCYRSGSRHIWDCNIYNNYIYNYSIGLAIVSTNATILG